MDLFAPSHILILLVVILVLFGAKRLPGAAQSLGQSMHIFRKSVKGMEDDQQTTGAQFTQATQLPQPPQAQSSAAPQPLTGQAGTTQPQLDDIQRQIAELQRLSAGGAGNGAASAEPQPNQQP